jgi:hypothetical protein
VLLRRIVIFALAVNLVVAMMVPGGIAFASHSSGTGPKQDKVNGTGKFSDAATGEARQIHANAKSDPSGQDPRGWIWEKATVPTSTGGTEKLDYKAKVTCLSVTDNKAVIGGEIVKSKSGETGNVEIYIEDNGEPGAGNDRVESKLLGTSVPDCSKDTEVTGKTITKGNYIVHDAPII